APDAKAPPAAKGEPAAAAAPDPAPPPKNAPPPEPTPEPPAPEKPIWSSFSLPRIKMPTWPELKPGLILDKLPSIRLPKIHVPKIHVPKIHVPKIQMPKVRLPKMQMPNLQRPHLHMPHLRPLSLSLSPSTRRKLLIGSAATAAFALTLLFAKHAGQQPQTDAPDAGPGPTAEAIIKTPPKAKDAPEASVQTKSGQNGKAGAPDKKAQKTESRLSTLQNLPPVGQVKDEDIQRLMRTSKLPRDVVEEALHIFQHSTPDDYKTKPGDKIELVFSQARDVLFARVHAQRKTQDIYGFEDGYGNYGFYTEKGKRVDKTGMTSPVDQFEINSPRLTRVFNVYRHPIHRVRKHHSGIDFPVARGTPVYAVSDGIIKAAKRMGGYGKTVSIEHDAALSSRYAHLDRYAGLKPGTRVQKGQIIGYAGSTGWSTGPHLHFEILKNGRAVNPRTITAFSAPVIARAEREDFKSAVTRIKDYLSGKPDPLTVAHTAEKPTPLEKLKDIFHRPGDEKIKQIIMQAAQRDGINPDLPYRLFIKEATVKGKLNAAARSDTGAEGLCQFTTQTFMAVLKKHGPRLGYGEYAQKIRSTVGDDKITYYTAGRHTPQILALRKDKTIAIPLCTAYMRDNIDHLTGKLGRPLNFTDVSIAHFFGPGIAADFIPAYDNPRTRKQYAHKFAQRDTLTGTTNRSIFFKGGDSTKPYTVEEVYNKKRAQMGTQSALWTETVRAPARDTAQATPQNTPLATRQAALQPGR
ncbi:MAG TPA: M23 family metallopeptidase, partial [Micavibrio sp.]